jgi:hypothetical protein
LEDCLFYLSELEHTERLAKAKDADDISSHERPPLEQIRNTSLSINLDLLNSKQSLLTDGRFPMFSEICFAEATSEKLPALAMFTRITHGKNTQSGKVSQLLVPDIFGELGRDGVNLLESGRVCDGDFCW